MSANKLNIEGIMLFEQPFARVPYENYRKVFRASQKNIEKELTAVQTAANDIAKRAKSGSSSSEDAVNALDSMITRVETLKRKLADLQSSSGASTIGVMRERFKHLSSVEGMQASSDPEFARWADTRLDRWLVDWSLRNGKEKTAKMIADERRIERLVDIELFSDIRRIEDALKQRSCTEALTWCSENKSALRKVKNTLEFDLRLQEYIELARVGKNLEAIAYSKKHLLPWQESHLPQIRQASALLCFPPSTTCSPYKRLYDLSRWNTLIQSFRLAIYNLSTLSSEPLLHLAMYAGLASLKLPACYDPQTKNVDCPVCDPSLGKLAEEVPFSHHVNSTIVCRITGKIMNEDNMPMAFPNSGQVYSREALEDMAARNDGIVKDPKTGETCEFSALRRLFIS
ncbi:CTLH/CRA C-terminal to lish motif domain-containing protein [Fomitopsis serialis]|uniref:CTLH/CRA C-terminal to lish motif domain-containing protein n=1 Tax=Fomitopsis serialis TaxID=139415 RepID=UPI00200749C6|nr:CTLH/CRA C-terminal to lish motif domain-containing protein [Neoantrodia serialis]KAH9933054.1 CTLH/CRA C-terminal to lish motif domain-containing protein [Neoantrodia serialis]